MELDFYTDTGELYENLIILDKSDIFFAIILTVICDGVEVEGMRQVVLTPDIKKIYDDAKFKYIWR